MFPGITNPLDVAFLIDASKDVTDKMLMEMKSFVEDQLKTFNISLDRTRVSLITYGDKTKVVLLHGNSSTAGSSSLNKLEVIGGQRRLDLALNKVRHTVFSSSGNAREKAGKLAVVLVTGSTVYQDQGILLQRLML